MIARYSYIKVTNNLFKIRLSPVCVLRKHLSGINVWDQDLSTTTKHNIEKRWSKKFQQDKNKQNVENNLEKYYVLSMFPYPSGKLHMGHVRVYTISDCVARFQRMNGKNVIHPIGWDAFGLPAENAAIDRNVSPDVWTQQNILQMKSQLHQLGVSFEWDRELTTCDPKYYKWTQYIFLRLFEAGLAYQKKSLVNWDPVDKTVLADEQVDENGCSWRSGARVEKKLLKQWFIRTTRYAKQLLDGLNDPELQDWRDVTKLQRHWIGDCVGVSFEFKIDNCSIDSITLWTSTPEYLEHAKFIAVSSSNILAKESGVEINGTKLLKIRAINPVTQEALPIYVTEKIDFLPETDSHLGIPACSEFDKGFALSVNIRLSEEIINYSDDIKNEVQQKNCDKAKKFGFGGYWTSAKLRDWLISRQRYWGTPIPIVHCEKCGPCPVPESDLPVVLPKLNKISQKGGSYLAECTEWLNTKCPNCGSEAKRETDTMDTFVDSSWYYLRYIDPDNENKPFSTSKAKELTPVDLYIGGKEHAVLHLYYARFINHFLHSIGMVPTREPFKRLLVQGMVMGRSYRIKGSGQYLPENKVNIINLKKGKAECKETKQPVVIAWEKMSKSKLNGVDPDEMFNEYGVDTTRLLILADVAPTSHRNWNSNTFPGILNWQHRLWITIQNFRKHRNNLLEFKSISDEMVKEQEDYLYDSRNYYIKGTTFNYCSSQQISVAVSKLQGLTNSLRKAPQYVIGHSLQFERALASQIVMLAPMAPHFASELWDGFISAENRINASDEIQWEKSVLEQAWPQVDWDYKLDLVCKINGFEHSIIKIPRKDLENYSKSEVVEIVMENEDIQNIINKYNVKDIHYEMHIGYESVIHFKVNATYKELSNEMQVSPPKKIEI